MERKQFEIIAGSLRKSRQEIRAKCLAKGAQRYNKPDEVWDAFDIVLANVVSSLQETNARFDAGKFRDAVNKD